MKEDPRALAETLRNYVSEQRAAREVLIVERDELIARKLFLYTAPLNDADVKQFIFDYIDQKAKQFSERQIPTLLRKFSHPSADGQRLADPSNPSKGPRPLNFQETLDAMEGKESQVFGIGGSPGVFTAGQGLAALDGAACFYLGDAVKTHIDEKFEEFNQGLSPEEKMLAGPPTAERIVELETIETRLQAITKEVAAIDANIADITHDPNEDAQRAHRQQQAIAAEAIRARNAEIVRAYNGRNEVELAQRFRLSAREVKAIGDRG